MDNFTSSKGPFFNLLKRYFLTNDNFVTVNAILLYNVGKDAFKDIASVLSSYLVHSFSHLSVSALVANNALCSSKCMVSSKYCISFATIDFTFTYNNSLSGVGSIAIKMSTCNNLYDVSLFECD